MSSRYDNFNMPFDVAVTTLLGLPLAASSPAALVAAFAPTNGTDQTPAILTQPKNACITGSIISLSVTDADGSITYGRVALTGKDRHGRLITDTITPTPGAGSAIYYSSKAFYDEVVATTHFDGAGGGDQVSLGLAPYSAGGEGGVGVPFDINDATDISAKTRTNVDNGTIDAADQVWHLATNPDGAATHRIAGRSTQ